MSFRKSLSACTLSVLTLAFAGVAHGWGVGGAIISPYKSVSDDRDLFCDLDNSIANIHATTSPKAFTFEGVLICWEVKHDSNDPEADRVSPKGLFELTQVRMEGGLEFMVCSQGDADCDDGGLPPTGETQKRTTWVFTIQQGRNQDLLWRLTPIGQSAIKEFCKDQNGHPISPDYCAVNIGLDEHDKATSTYGIPDGGGNGEDANDYPAMNVGGGGDDLRKGEVFRFTTTTGAGKESFASFFWGPCHSGQYGKFAFPGCEFRYGTTKKKTRTKGKGKQKHDPLMK